MQALWDLDSSQLDSTLGEDMSRWQRMLTDITRARATFDTSMSFKQFGPIIIHFEQVWQRLLHGVHS